MEVDVKLLIAKHKQAIEDRELCLNSIKETEYKNDIDKSNVCNLAIAARGYLSVIEALDAIMKNNGIVYADEHYFQDITPEDNEEEAEDSTPKKASKEK